MSLFTKKDRTTYIPPPILPGDDGPFCIPRQMVHLREELARTCGYFWLPCPLCGFDFAGFEVGKCRVPDPDDPHRGTVGCRWCDEEVLTKQEVFGP